MERMTTKQAKKAWTCRQVMKELKSMGSAQTIKTYRNHGITGEMFGVSYANLKALDKRVPNDQKLAEELWATGNADARTFACWKADENVMTAKDLDAWARDVDNPGTSFELGALAAFTDHGAKLSRKWRKLKSESRRGMGWRMVGTLAMQPDRPESEGGISDAELTECLATIEATIHAEENNVRQSMNTTLICIGGRSSMMKKALATAKRVGEVYVDQGNTGCKTAVAYDKIKKVAEHYEAKGKKPTDGAGGKRRRHC